ncbi:hypothetical protein OIU78_013007 [Salix suchowensis]|nr:hypothetical protein OIU78_013007 [Salix suchowensis]
MEGLKFVAWASGRLGGGFPKGSMSECWLEGGFFVVGFEVGLFEAGFASGFFEEGSRGGSSGGFLLVGFADVDGRLVFRVDIVRVVLGSYGGVAAAMRRLGFWGAFVEARFWFPSGFGGGRGKEYVWGYVGEGTPCGAWLFSLDPSSWEALGFTRMAIKLTNLAVGWEPFILNFHNNGIGR